MKRTGNWEFRHWMTAANTFCCWALLFGLAKWGSDSQIHLLLAQGSLMLLGGTLVTYAGSKGLEAYFVSRFGLIGKSFPKIFSKKVR